jgi:ATP-dependent DNA helicase RecG
MQRARLQEKGSFPHILVMTATPIPRTLSMTVYGDLDVSIIDEMPQGRKPIKTFWIPEKKRDDLYRYVKKQVAEGRQVYWVYPLVEKSEKLDLKAVEEYYEQLKEEIFPDLRLGMIHGRMKPIEKELTMQDFKRWKLDVLVATTVIEVGIDVPNATVIVIEDSIRFGLAQLHQLRGRVGRGDHQSYCILMGEAKSPESKERLRVMCNTNDGFKIAEADLQIRGPGEFFGFRQSGLPELRIGSLISDIKLMELARKEAMELFAGPERLTSLKSLLNSVQKRFTYKMQVAGVA